MKLSKRYLKASLNNHPDALAASMGSLLAIASIVLGLSVMEQAKALTEVRAPSAVSVQATDESEDFESNDETPYIVTHSDGSQSACVQVIEQIDGEGYPIEKCTAVGGAK